MNGVPVIEKNVPIPEGPTLLSTLKKMQVGDSFETESVSDCTNCHVLARTHQMKVTTRKQGPGKWRVWRIQ